MCIIFSTSSSQNLILMIPVIIIREILQNLLVNEMMVNKIVTKENSTVFMVSYNRCYQQQQVKPFINTKPISIELIY